LSGHKLRGAYFIQLEVDVFPQVLIYCHVLGRKQTNGAPMSSSTITPVQIEYRPASAKAAFVFVHGFGGDTSATWGEFPKFLMEDRQLESWGVFGLGYASSIRVDVPGLWSGDASISVLAQGLQTALSLPPFDRCEAIAIAAHSMGGLVAQRAILSDERLRERLSHLFLFGTPSGGLVKAWFGSLFKPQLADMRARGPFIKTLRAEWDERFGDRIPFLFRAVGGERDEFVPAGSSIGPFPDKVRAVVPGNHVQIVKPDKPDHRSVLIVRQGLKENKTARGSFDSARLAVELRKFNAAVKMLLPSAAELDDAALVALALALDGLGRGEEALQVLEKHYGQWGTTSIDALGVLGGRFKRQWLAGRRAADLQRARELYTEGLSKAEAAGDAAQSSYHAINLAFLDLMAAPATAGVPDAVRAMAARALQYGSEAQEDHWRLATQAEAALMMKDIPKATDLYARALAKAQSERDRDSMYSQAVRIAERLFGEQGVKQIEALSGFH
jgi:pimeloyl-ACP methyl ester carboxylesterase